MRICRECLKKLGKLEAVKHLPTINATCEECCKTRVCREVAR
jgi:hypothetical protein